MLRTAVFVVAILALAAPVGARFLVQTAVSGLQADPRPARHPRTETHVLRVAREVAGARERPGDGATILVQYWRTSSRNPNQGNLSVRVKILREPEGGGKPEIVYRARINGRVGARHFDRTLIGLPDLRPGDLIVTSFRMRGMPRLQRHDAAYAETLLRERPSE